MNSKYLLCIFMILLICPLLSGKPLNSYEQMAARQQTPYLEHNGECVSFDGVIWTRNFGMKEYFISPSYSDINSSLQAIKASGSSSGGHKLIKLALDQDSRAQLTEFNVKIPVNYPFNTINVLIPAFYLDQLRFEYTILPYNATDKPENSRPANRQVVYEQGFEEDLGDEYDINGWMEQPHVIYRNICWGVVDCEYYEGSQSLWCAADLYDNGWYTDPPEPCSSYTAWMWTYFARLQTIDVTVADELVFEWWSDYAINYENDGDFCRVYIQDYPNTDWMMISEYWGFSSWTDFQYELEGMSNVAYYFDFESDNMDQSGGVYIDNISIYNTLPNLTIGENFALEYPYNYSTAEPHKLYYNYEILNDSNIDVYDNFEIEFILSTDDDYTTIEDNYQLEELSITNSILAGESIIDDITFNLDNVNIPGVGDLPEGDYYVMFMVDNNDVIFEYNEEDNLLVTTNTLTYGSTNLTYSDQCSYTYPASPNTAILQIDIQILNEGSEPNNDSFEIGYMISADDDIGTQEDNYSLGYSTVSEAIQPGGSYEYTFSIDLDQIDLPADDYWVVFFIDAYYVIPESNESDNIWASQDQFIYQGEDFLSVDPLELTFEADAGTQMINISSNTDWAITNNHAWISVTPTSGNGDASVSVTVSQNPTNEPRNATISVSGAGEEFIVDISQEAGSNLVYGDVNSSGVVDSYDAALTLQFVVEIPTGIDPFPIVIADVDGSGDVSAFDAALILQYVVGVIDNFPVENPRSQISD